MDSVHFKNDKRLKTNPFFKDKKELKMRKKIKIKSILQINGWISLGNQSIHIENT